MDTNEENWVMAANVGGIDRTLRIVVGIVVLALFFVLEGNARYWALVGVVPLFTGCSGSARPTRCSG